MATRTVDQLLDAARTRIDRVDPHQAQRWIEQGAVLIDIRPHAQRKQFGEVPGAWLVERNVLEWRFDPRSEAKLGPIEGYDRPLIVLCQEGYASSFAAASLRDLGHTKVADLDGGFAAWQAAGLPTQAAR